MSYRIMVDNSDIVMAEGQTEKEAWRKFYSSLEKNMPVPSDISCVRHDPHPSKRKDGLLEIQIQLPLKFV